MLMIFELLVRHFENVQLGFLVHNINIAYILNMLSTFKDIMFFVQIQNGRQTDKKNIVGLYL